MKSRLIVMLSGFMMLAGCQVPEAAYYQNYKKDYIYSVGYYGYRPYDWGYGYYDTYGWGTRDWDAERSPYSLPPTRQRLAR